MAGEVPRSLTHLLLVCSEEKHIDGTIYLLHSIYSVLSVDADGYRFVQGFRNDYVNAVAMHGFNVWEVNKHCK